MELSGEFGFIEHIAAMFAGLGQAGIEGIGDDCAAIPAGNGEAWVVTTDMLVEGVHFVRRAITPHELGRKSLAVNLSDIAAMGARPVCTLLSVALPAECRGAWAEAFAEGYHALSAEFGVALAGGDTTASPEGVVVNVVAIGRAPVSHIKRRSAALPGDIVLVTGPLGESAAGLADVLAGRYDTPLARIHHNPTPQVRQGEWLGNRDEVHAMIDLSDGLASDLPHIMRLSGVGAWIETTAVPAPAGIVPAVSGGEDYQLLLTADAAHARELCRDFAAYFDTPLYVIGGITDPEMIEVEWRHDGKTLTKVEWHGFSHF